MSNIFRKEALERQALPRQYDQLVQIITLERRLWLVAIFSLLIAFAIWLFAGRITTSLDKTGVVENNIAVSHVAANEAKELQPGMQAWITLAEGEQMRGTITEIRQRDQLYEVRIELSEKTDNSLCQIKFILSEERPIQYLLP